MPLSKTLYPLLSTGSTKENRKMFRDDWENVDWDVKHQHKQSPLYVNSECYDQLDVGFPAPEDHFS